MPEGMATATANSILNAIFNNTSYAVTQAYIKLHTGAPGASGTTNPATETTRKSVSMGAASGGAISNDADIVWSGISGSEDATHFSLWDTVGPAGGTFIGSGTITANAYVAGDTYTIPSGDLDISLTVAS